MGLLDTDALERINITKRTTRLMMRKRCFIDKLGDDELLDILIRLPDVHRCKCVSKRWLNLISHPTFRHSYVQFHKPGHPQADDHFIIASGCKPDKRKPNDTNMGFTEFRENVNAGFCSKSHLFDFSFSFVPSLSKQNLKDFTLLRVSNGLILSEAQFSTTSATAFYVCHPLTKQWLEIPSPLDSPLYPGAVGFMCHETYTSTTLLTLIIVHMDDKLQSFAVCLFSSDYGQWVLYRVPYPPGFSSPKTALNTVVCNGRFHWNGETNIVVYDPSTKASRRTCDVINLPADHHHDAPTGSYSERRCIDVSQGLIRFYNLIREPLEWFTRFVSEELWIWDLVDYEKRLWSPKFNVSITNPARKFECFSEVDRNKYYTANTHAKSVFCNSIKKSDYLKLDTLSTERQMFPYVRTIWPVTLPPLKTMRLE